MNCPYCKYILKLKELKQGLHGRCPHCRFAGYLPKIEVRETTDEVKEEVRERSVEGNNNEEIIEGKCPVCNKSYKTEKGLYRHFDRVGYERELHPRIYKRHEEYFRKEGGS